VDEWPELWGDPLLASAGLDRLAHAATVVTITGKSYRLSHRPPAKEDAMPPPD
jgi:DNA replication protein DnaC